MIFEGHFFELSELTPLPNSDTGRNEDGRDCEEEKVCLCEEVEWWVGRELVRGQLRGVMGGCWSGVFF